MDPIQSINFKKDTSLLILLAAKKSGFTLYLIEQNDLYLDCDEPRALTAELNVFDDEKEWFELEHLMSLKSSFYQQTARKSLNQVQTFCLNFTVKSLLTISDR